MAPDVMGITVELPETELAALLERYRGALVSLALDRTGRFEAAQDIAQEALVLAWQHRTDLREAKSFGAWLFRIGLNCCVAWQRGERRATAPIEAMTQQATPEPSFFEELIRRDTIREVRRILAEVALPVRVALLMSAMGYSRSEIAEFLNVPESTVRGRIARARALLRKTLGTRLEQTLADKERNAHE